MASGVAVSGPLMKRIVWTLVHVSPVSADRKIPSLTEMYAVGAAGATRLFAPMVELAKVVVQVMAPSVLFRMAPATTYTVRGCDGLTTSDAMKTAGPDRGVHELPPSVLT